MKVVCRREVHRQVVRLEIVDHQLLRNVAGVRDLQRAHSFGPLWISRGRFQCDLLLVFTAAATGPRLFTIFVFRTGGDDAESEKSREDQSESTHGVLRSLRATVGGE